MQKAPGQSDQGQVDLERGPWGFGGPCMLRYRSRAVEVPLGSQKNTRGSSNSSCNAKGGGRAPRPEALDVRYKKTPDLGGQSQTRGWSLLLGGSQAWMNEQYSSQVWHRSCWFQKADSASRPVIVRPHLYHLDNTPCVADGFRGLDRFASWLQNLWLELWLAMT